MKVVATIAASPVAQATLIGGFGGIASLVGVSADYWGMGPALWITAASIAAGIAIAIFFGRHAAKEQQAQSATLARVDERTASLEDMPRMIREMYHATLGKAQQSAPVEESTKQALEDALERLARDAAAGSYTAAGIVERRNVSDVVDYLSAREARIEASRAAVNQRVDEELIAILREKAAVAYLTGRIADAETAARRALELLPTDWSMTLLLGKLHRDRGSYPLAIEAFRRAATVAGAGSRYGDSLLNMAWVFEDRGQPDVALDLINQARDAYAQAADELGIGCAAQAAILLYSRIGDTSSARAAAEEAERVFRRVGQPDRLANLFATLGVFFYEQFDFDKASQYYREAERVLSAMGNQPRELIAVIGNLGNIARVLGDAVEAEARYRRVIELSRRFEYVASESMGWDNLGISLVLQRRDSEALAAIQKAVDLDRGSGRIAGLCHSLGHLGMLGIIMGQKDTGIRQVMESLDLAERVKQNSLVTTLRWVLATVEQGGVVDRSVFGDQSAPRGARAGTVLSDSVPVQTRESERPDVASPRAD